MRVRSVVRRFRPRLVDAPRRGPLTTVLVAALALVLVAGCSNATSGSSNGANPGAAPGRTLTVVASTNVWGSVVSAIAGPGVTVDSIIKDPNADPHSYESTPADAAAISRADLVVWNGGGYDEFVQKALDADPAAKAKAISAFDLKADKADDNEHVWFDLNVVKGVVTGVTDRLAAIEPAQAEPLRQRASMVTQRLDAEAAQIAAIGRAKPGSSVISTEPIAHYLLLNAGVADRTPTEFVEAIENENDPAPAVVQQVTTTLTGKQVNALVFNPQTETPVTQQIRDGAQRAGVPVVNVTETLPDGQDYFGWLDGNRTALATALGAPTT